MCTVDSDRDRKRATSSKEGGGRDITLTFLSWTHLVNAAPGATSQYLVPMLKKCTFLVPK